MNLMRRLRNLWKQSESVAASEVDTLTLLRALYDEEEAQRRYALMTQRMGYEPVGDGGAVFLSDMTEAEYEDYVYDETHGWKGFREKIKNLPTTLYGKLTRRPTETTDR